MAATAATAAATAATSASAPLASTLTNFVSSKLKLHHVKGGFKNIWPTWRDTELGQVFKWALSRKSVDPLASKTAGDDIRVVKPDLERLHHPPSDAIQVTWMGHASVLVQMDGVNILTDPVWSKRCSPSQLIGPARYRPPPLELSELPPIDAVCISHNHYDHLDYATVTQLGNRPKWYVPLGLKKWFAGVNISNVVELDWWEEHALNRDVKFAAVPAQHWSGRMMLDRNDTLWGGWVAVGQQGRSFYFAGDTGMCSAFKEIGETYGPITLAAIPIGAYQPRAIMQPQHIDPIEAVQIHQDIKAENSIGIHWGTFVLTDEDVTEPPRLMRQASEAAGLAPEAFFVLPHGGTQVVRPQVAATTATTEQQLSSITTGATTSHG